MSFPSMVWTGRAGLELSLSGGVCFAFLVFMTGFTLLIEKKGSELIIESRPTATPDATPVELAYLTTVQIAVAACIRLVQERYDASGPQVSHDEISDRAAAAFREHLREWESAFL